MPDLVQCPNCGKPVAVPKGIDQGELEAAISKVFSSSTFCQQFPSLCNRVANIEKAMTTHPKPSKEFIRTQWEKCPECHADWEAIKRDIQEEALRTHHPVLSEELMNHFATCPECRVQAEKFGIPLPESKVEEQEKPFAWMQ